MAGPFPGMDPYIECQANWLDFHNTLVSEIRNALGSRLPDDYVARIDERVEIVDFDGPTGKFFVPDVLLGQTNGGRGQTTVSTPVASTLEPEIIEVGETEPEEVRHSWLEIRRLPDMSLVTVVEILSPVNKSGTGRIAYLGKREELYAKRVNLVEIDLLLGGRRLPMRKPLALGDYLAIVARGTRFPRAEVYRWSLRDPLPLLPIPLREPDPDVLVDLNDLVARIYDLGRYGRTLRHEEALPETLPINPDDRAWVEEVARNSGRSSV